VGKNISDLFPDAESPDPASRIRSAASRIRLLRSQVGQDGFTPSAARSLLDELSAALEACAAAVEERGR